ncbi:MAG: sulfatase-like hydrolase/transferase [Verrucomicrobiales bacterium]|nr:sulfatase-like hydrolase/transferase [Verrucomicrobiales bacterium]
MIIKLPITILSALGLLFVSAGAAEKPNILFIMADDLGIEGLSCYGSDSYETPHLDRLADEGMRFSHAYSQPLCTPTRVQIMTGKYNHRNWLYFGILDPGERTFGHLMQDAGYKTCIAGKWQLQSYDPPEWPNSERRRGTGMKVEDAGFDEWSLYHAWETEDKGSRYANPSFDWNGTLQGPLDGQYGPDTSVEFLLDCFENRNGKPLFAYFAMALPHWPMVPTPDSEEWKEPAQRLDESVDFFPDMVHYMDKVVGQLVDGLVELGERENTIVIFYGDNGTDMRVTSQFRGEAIQGGKASPLQTGIRVPLIANWPGKIKAGEVSSDLVDASDFLPTFASLAGSEIPGDWVHDGISFVPELLGEEGPKREMAFFWYDPRPGWDKEKFSRHVFALNHDYKLFSDGRLYDVKGDGLREELLDVYSLTGEQKLQRDALADYMQKMMSVPMSASAKIEVDAYGDPVE